MIHKRFGIKYLEITGAVAPQLKLKFTTCQEKFPFSGPHSEKVGHPCIKQLYLFHYDVCRP